MRRLDISQGAVDPSTGVEVHLLNPEQIEYYWPNIAYLLDLVPHTWEDETKESFKTRALCSQMQIWVVGKDEIQLVIFTQLADRARTRNLEVVWAAGSGMLQEAGSVVDASLEFFAQTQRCDNIVVIGRMGWERVLEKWGFRRSALILKRPVADRRKQ